MTGMLARSKSGHDKGRVYAVIRVEGSFVYLSDGKLRPVNRPKKKNICHIQPIIRLPEEVRELLKDIPAVTDEQVKRAIKCYRQASEQQL
ncbi:MAG: hypothetical protein ACOX8G_09430 [Eubacterium sp.]|jgi:ribosomal protein L14E/L6E/L27E